MKPKREVVYHNGCCDKQVLMIGFDPVSIWYILYWCLLLTTRQLHLHLLCLGVVHIVHFLVLVQGVSNYVLLTTYCIFCFNVFNQWVNPVSTNPFGPKVLKPWCCMWPVRLAGYIHFIPGGAVCISGVLWLLVNSPLLIDSIVHGHVVAYQSNKWVKWHGCWQ